MCSSNPSFLNRRLGLYVTSCLPVMPLTEDTFLLEFVPKDSWVFMPMCIKHTAERQPDVGGESVNVGTRLPEVTS